MKSKCSHNSTLAHKKLSARTADRHALYEASVQDTEWEARWIARRYQSARGKPAQSLREDFCGTAQLCRDWLSQHRQRTATGIDLDQQVIEWGRTHHFDPSLCFSHRMTYQCANVLEIRIPADVIVAFNFSYFIFRTRAELRQYFTGVRQSLPEDGLFIMDIYGGTQAGEVLEETRKCDNFTYIWDQHTFNPITHDTQCRIHFKFQDGSMMRNAFIYNWRLWTIPEVRELLAEAGFSDSTVYWQCSDQNTGDFNGVYRAATTVENAAGWIAFIVAHP